MIKILNDLVGKYGRICSDPSIPLISVNELRAAILVVDAELLRWKKAVEGLTPGGSEFVDNPEACAAYIRKRIEYPSIIVELKAQQKELVEALVYARRFLNSKDHDVAYVDSLLARVKGV